jgi:ABC-type Fe3+ transport system permease subunit
MGLGQLPPLSAAPVVMNVAGGLRVEVSSASSSVDISQISAPVAVAQAVALRVAARRPQSKSQKANNLIHMLPTTGPGCAGK